jgi:hypothetical protein
MNKKFVIPGLLTYDTEATHIITASDADFTINAKKVLSAGDLVGTQNAAPITLDGGASITTMTVRGVSALPADYKVEVGTMEIVIPAFNVTAVSAGTISVITLHQTIKKPLHDTVYPFTFNSSAGVLNGKIEYYAASGNLAFSKVDGTAFTVPFGPYFDVVLPIY